jgi:hypothetical protein
MATATTPAQPPAQRAAGLSTAEAEHRLAIVNVAIIAACSRARGEITHPG